MFVGWAYVFLREIWILSRQNARRIRTVHLIWWRCESGWLVGWTWIPTLCIPRAPAYWIRFWFVRWIRIQIRPYPLSYPTTIKHFIQSILSSLHETKKSYVVDQTLLYSFIFNFFFNWYIVKFFFFFMCRFNKTTI